MPIRAGFELLRAVGRKKLCEPKSLFGHPIDEMISTAQNRRDLPRGVTRALDAPSFSPYLSPITSHFSFLTVLLTPSGPLER